MENLLKKIINSAVVNALLLNCAWAISTPDIIKVIQNSHVIPANQQVQAVLRNKEVILSMYYSPKASDKDCKIDAVLLGRAIMNRYPKDISLVRVYFYDTVKNNEYRMVVVRSGDIKSFGGGNLDENLLFSLIDVVKGKLNSNTRVLTNINMLAPGIRLEERQSLLASILACKKHGGNVSVAMNQFMKLEDAVKANNEYLVDKYLISIKREVDILTYNTQARINAENSQAPSPSDASYNELAQVYSLITQVQDHGDKIDSQLISTYDQLHNLSKSSANASQVAQGCRLLTNLLLSKYKFLKPY